MWEAELYMTEPGYRSTFKSSGGFTRILRAARYSCQGLKAAFKYEAAFRQELLLAAVLAPLAFWLGDTALQIAGLLALLVFVLVVELLNSAIEALADTITTDPHPLLGRAKDLGSAAVLLSMIGTALVWGAAAVARLL